VPSGGSLTCNKNLRHPQKGTGPTPLCSAAILHRSGCIDAAFFCSLGSFVPFPDLSRPNTQHASGPCRLVDGLHINDVTIIDVVVDRLEFCRVDLKKPARLYSLGCPSGGDGLAACGVFILRQRPHRSFHRTAVLQSYHAPHLSPRLSRLHYLPLRVSQSHARSANLVKTLAEGCPSPILQQPSARLSKRPPPPPVRSFITLSHRSMP
jgi:hypothetical protein